MNFDDQDWHCHPESRRCSIAGRRKFAGSMTCGFTWTELLNRLQKSGEALISNAVIVGTFLLRACIVNFRTSLEDIEALPVLVARIGREVDIDMRPVNLKK